MNLNAALGYINFHEGLARRPKGKPISTNFSLTFIKKKSINDKLPPTVSGSATNLDELKGFAYLAASCCFRNKNFSQSSSS